MHDRAGAVPGEYSLAQRAVEKVSIAVFLALACYAWALMAGTFHHPRNVAFAAVGFFTALLPRRFCERARPLGGRYLGPAHVAVRRERLHSRIQGAPCRSEAITRHDFVETKGPTLREPACAGCGHLSVSAHRNGVMLTSVLTGLCLWILATNQFHKWAHRGRATEMGATSPESPAHTAACTSQSASHASVL